MHIKWTYALACILVLILTNGCSTAVKKPGDLSQLNAKQIYDLGKSSMAEGNYAEAIRAFKALEIYYPEQPHSIQGQLEIAYAYYKNNDSSSAIASADRFINDYPLHVNVDYAYYLKGLATFDSAVNSADGEKSELNPPKQMQAEISLQYFSELIKRFPLSKYSDDAKQRVKYLNEKLAQHEIRLAKHFTDKGDYANAALHARSVIANYPDTPSITEAASITNIAYNMLGIEKSSAGSDIQNDAGLQSTKITFDDADQPDTLVWPPKNDHAVVNTNTKPKPHSSEPQPKIKSKPAARTTSGTNGAINTGQWVLDQNSNYYTLQILGTSNEKSLIDLIKTNNLGNEVAYFEKMVNNKSWFTLVFGTYKSRSEASIAARNLANTGLPAELRNKKPWIRKFGDIKPDVVQ
ncbi:MAG: outer membrane protein assembly factor BamD [Gammaproteobacteria bacterium]